MTSLKLKFFKLKSYPLSNVYQINDYEGYKAKFCTLIKHMQVALSPYSLKVLRPNEVYTAAFQRSSDSLWEGKLAVFIKELVETVAKESALVDKWTLVEYVFSRNHNKYRCINFSHLPWQIFKNFLSTML